MDKVPCILLVEDNPMDRELTKVALREAGLNIPIHMVQNGTEALEYLFGNKQYADRRTYPLPALVLLDLKLPGVSGFEVLRKIKETPVLKRLIVAVLTSSKEEKDRISSYDAGANSYLVKPVSFDGFVRMVRQVADYWLTLNVGPPDAG